MAVLLLVAAAVAVKVVPPICTRRRTPTVGRVVTIALLCILFDGGMHLGWAGAVRGAHDLLVGVLGTFLTAGRASALLPHARCSASDWFRAPDRHGSRTDRSGGGVQRPRSAGGRWSVGHRPRGRVRRERPGRHRAAGPSPCGGFVDGGRRGGRRSEFLLQMGVGAALGADRRRVLLCSVLMRRVSLPSEGLYSLRTPRGCSAAYGVSTATLPTDRVFRPCSSRASLIGEERAPFKRRDRPAFPRGARQPCRDRRFHRARPHC